MTFRAQGMRAWLLQRLSAVYMALWLAAAGLVWWWHGAWDYTAWINLLAHPFVNISLALLFISILIHAWVGIRDVLVDYVPRMSLRFVILIGMATYLVAMGIWAALILISVVRI
jgi:succinate dehydrogenase / fumarate reductase membrane anchor subunit